jgi:diacylglycerol kinase (ATP)
VQVTVALKLFCSSRYRNSVLYEGHGYGYESRVSTVHLDEEKRKGEAVPFLIFINKKSGGRRGASLLRSLKSTLGTTEICDLEESSASEYLEQVKTCPHVRIVVCGGDGTVGRIMDTWKSIAAKDCHTEFGIIPLGTGNDMFKQLVKQYRRMTKFQMKAMYCRKPPDELGIKIVSLSSPKQLKENPNDIYRLFKDPKVVPLDRWGVLTSIEGSPTSSMTMNNYFGVGVDGAVSLEFDKLRQKRPRLFFHRHVNKMWYALMGVKSILKRSSPELSSSCKLICDGNEVRIPDGTQGIIALNINSYAGQ